MLDALTDGRATPSGRSSAILPTEARQCRVRLSNKEDVMDGQINTALNFYRVFFRLYSQNVLIWCILLETLEDRADGAEGVSGLVVGGGYADGGAEGRDRGDFG